MRLFRLFLILSFFIFINFSAGAANKPKNVIILIGDGMGINYISTSLLSDPLSPFYSFKTIGFSITKSANQLVTDSAAGATAIATGYRTNNKMDAVTPDEKPLNTIFEFARNLGLSTGVVVTSDVTDATPSCFIAHDKSRYDKDKIAYQFTQSGTDLVIGGGLDFFLPENAGGKRKDNNNLVEQLKSDSYEFYNNFDELQKSNTHKKFYALFAPVGLPKAPERNYSLGQLANIALKNLSQDPDGFVLMVEGSQIDWAGHDDDADYLLSEVKDFTTAVKAALDFAEKDGNTLIIITADHETGGMAITGGDLDGSNLDLKFVSKDHTAGVVAVLAKGPGEENFSGIYGNYEIGRKLFHLFDPAYKFSEVK